MRPGENNAQDRKDCGPQEGDGHLQEHRLPQMWQADSYCETGKGSGTRRSGRDFYIVLSL